MSIFGRRTGTVVLAGWLSMAIAASASAGSHSVLYSFGTGGDGSGPAASLTAGGGLLYGTTFGGGAHGPGAVFQVSTTGTESVLYSFQNGADGANPKSPVVKVGGLLYGTTQNGGGAAACTGGCGTVFAVTTAGEEALVYAFQGGAGDGANPTAGLTKVGAVFYGTTAYGGANNYGTVFTITPDGTESVLYSFTGGADGGNPMGGLIHVHGKLYGTTYAGGANHYGTVFSITTGGVEKVVYSFKNTSDGAYPAAALVNIGKTLYGISSYGAAHLGTVFAVKPSGVFTVLHSFKGGSDGSEPKGDLVNIGHTLYGVTYQGGGTGCFSGLGCGTVFSVTPGQGAAVVYSFLGGSDGFNPDAGLLDIGGQLYGTTANGGDNFNGTVFVVSP